ncbi:hypothetical protein HYDPIDRAFT_32561 [Hydnomerulius pinastri MD-312]|uniref:NADAR domain-containing protein n=1 Tax=Hydnomerulius pinastri MD-312 TaxID=994086 RepID=A0A0C9VQX2_9AGAM|nr:hypothetical protein HYDPIDRAFT_32561 [Hydnomerulius pinastri MD-312]
MGIISSMIAGCIGCWDAADTHVVTSGGGSLRINHQHTSRSQPRRRQNKILFYEKGKPYYEFTNFSPHDVLYNGKKYPTSEHLFQSFKIAERIRTCGGKPMKAFDEAHKYQNAVRPDWAQVHVEKMEIALKLKFTQHSNLKKLLLDTGDAELVEDSPRDWFWGIGADGTGSNELGKALMRLRHELLHGAPTKTSYGRSNTAKSHAVGSSRGLCEFCRVKPKHQNLKYCSRACADQAATMCKIAATPAALVRLAVQNLPLVTETRSPLSSRALNIEWHDEQITFGVYGHTDS